MHTAVLAPSRISGGELASWRWEFVRLFIFKQKKTIWKVLRKWRWQKKKKKNCFCSTQWLFFLEGVKIIPEGLESQDMTAFFFFCLSFSQPRDFMFPATKKTHMEKVPLKDVVAVARGGNYGSHCWFEPCHLVRLKDL